MKKLYYMTIFGLFSLIAGLVYFTNSYAQTSSLDETTKDFYAENNIVFYEPCGSNSSFSGSLCGDTAAQKVWSGLRQFLTPEQAAGVIGNLANEGGLNPFCHQGGNYKGDWRNDEHGVGLAQWTDDSRRPAMYGFVFGKNANLESYFSNPSEYSYCSGYTGDVSGNYPSGGDYLLHKDGINISEVDQGYQYEIDFLHQEIDQGYTDLKNISSIDEAASYFAINFERCADCHPGSATVNARIKKSQELYDELKDFSCNSSNSTKSTQLFQDNNKQSSNDSSKSQGQNGSDVTIIGDSITEGSKDKILEKLPEADINAEVGRQFGHSGGLDVLSDFKKNNNLRKKLVFALGTNSTGLTQAEIDEVFSTAGDSTEVYLTTNWTTKDNYEHNNQLINSTPSWHKNAHVIDWASAIKADSGKYLGEDGIHPNDEGKQKFAELITNALNANGYDCNEGGGNSITDVTNKLAWPYGTEGGRPRSMKPEYEEAGKKYNPRYTEMDCGIFVATVIRASGADSEFPEAQTSTQTDYMANSSLWKEVSNSGDESDYMPGDVFSMSEHTFIYLGNGKKAEASRDEHYGVVHDLSWDSRPITSYRVFRLTSSSSQKAQTNNGVQCGCVDKNGGSGLKDGGFATKEEAEAFLIPKYNNDPLVPPLNLVMPPSGDYHHNCVAFSNWFLKDFSTITNGQTIQGNGNELAHNLYNTYHDSFPNLKESDMPSVYSIASWSTTKPNTPDGNHTGVIVGINQSTGKILIAEAGYNRPNFTGVHEYDLNTFIGNGSYYVDINAYLNKGGLK